MKIDKGTEWQEAIFQECIEALDSGNIPAPEVHPILIFFCQIRA